MQELIGSMVRFSTALTLYGLQQVRKAVTTVAAAPLNIDSFRQAVDSATNSLSSKIDETQKATLNSMTTMGADVIAKTFTATSDALRRTAETCTSVINRAAADSSAEPAAATGEPQAAADVLSR